MLIGIDAVREVAIARGLIAIGRDLVAVGAGLIALAAGLIGIGERLLAVGKRLSLSASVWPLSASVCSSLGAPGAGVRFSSCRLIAPLVDFSGRSPDFRPATTGLQDGEATGLGDPRAHPVDSFKLALRANGPWVRTRSI